MKFTKRIKGKDLKKMSTDELSVIHETLTHNDKKIIKELHKRADKAAGDLMNLRSDKNHHDIGDDYQEDIDSPKRLLKYALKYADISEENLWFPLRNLPKVINAVNSGIVPIDEQPFPIPSHEPIGLSFCKIYRKWRLGIGNIIPKITIKYPHILDTRFSAFHYLIEYDKIDATYGYYLRVIRSAMILYHCFGLDNIYDNTLRSQFVSLMSQLNFYFSPKTDFYKFNISRNPKLTGLTFRFHEKSNGHKSGLRVTPAKRPVSSCLDRFIKEGDYFDNLQIRSLEDSLVRNFPDIEDIYDLPVLYNLSIFNKYNEKTDDGVINPFKLYHQDHLLKELDKVIQKIYNLYIYNIRGIDVDLCSIEEYKELFDNLVRNDPFLKENLLRLLYAPNTKCKEE